MSDFFQTEPTRQRLIPFLKETELLMTKVLQNYDPSSSCKIYPLLDLGFPHDVVRIVGGFPTGIYVTWNCAMPFVPVDTTVNVCTSSAFKLSANILDALDEDFFAQVMAKLERTSFSLNFHRGNHFIVFAWSPLSGEHYLFIHTSAQEFKKTFNGLYPVPDNWYMNDVQVYREGSRRIRYIVGRKAETFVKIAHTLSPYNKMRHSFFAEVLTDGLCEIEDVIHHHHYQMPTDQSVLIGSLLLEAGEIGPLFTFPGDPIFLFRALPSDKNRVNVNGTIKYLLPHGWGKTSQVPPEMKIDLDRDIFTLNGVEYPIRIDASLRAHPDLTLRRFSTDEQDDKYYFELVKSYCDGVVVDKLQQMVSYNKHGFKVWNQMT